MPRESPNCNSMRVQRAARLNKLEDTRLDNTVHLYSKEHRRSARLHNQDMRIINLTLEFIQASSGHSPEGLPPEYKDPGIKQQLAPCFMYGERVISRRIRRGKSAQRGAAFSRRSSTSSSVTSATGTESSTVTGSTEDSESSSESSESSQHQRPLSSPVKGMRDRRQRMAELSRQRPHTAMGKLVPRKSSISPDLSIESYDSDSDPDTLVQRITSAKSMKRTSEPASRSHTPSESVRVPTGQNTFLTEGGDCESEISHNSVSAMKKKNRPMSSSIARGRSCTPVSSRPQTAMSYTSSQGRRGSSKGRRSHQGRGSLQGHGSLQVRRSIQGRNRSGLRMEEVDNNNCLPPEMAVLERVIELPVTSKLRQQKVMEYKKNVNENKSKVVNDKMLAFMNTLPVRV